MSEPIATGMRADNFVGLTSASNMNAAKKVIILIKK
jgi:hypothetical protein